MNLADSIAETKLRGFSRLSTSGKLGGYPVEFNVHDALLSRAHVQIADRPISQKVKDYSSGETLRACFVSPTGGQETFVVITKSSERDIIILDVPGASSSQSCSFLVDWEKSPKSEKLESDTAFVVSEFSTPENLEAREMDEDFDPYLRLDPPRREYKRIRARLKFIGRGKPRIAYDPDLD